VWVKISAKNDLPLFKAFVTIGILVIVFGLAFIIIDLVVNEFTEGLRLIGSRFVIVGIVTIAIAFVYKHHVVIGFILRQFKNRLTDQDRFSKWYKP
jgi:purine-cytosine permease-like protein